MNDSLKTVLLNNEVLRDKITKLNQDNEALRAELLGRGHLNYSYNVNEE
jgi:hypothetical protein